MSSNSREPRSTSLVRIFIPTYRRPALLPRAVYSLLAQTFTQWVAEIHNDDPADLGPAKLVEALNDSRIELRQHERNLGAAGTFNQFYRPTREPFYCLLEDDNWWEPDFLATMVHEMHTHPEVIIAWCNQKIWEEQADGSWRDTGTSVGASNGDANPRLLPFGHPQQMLGALHSNGAMIVRSRLGEIYETPSDWPFAAVEAMRERMMQHPLLFVPKPLAVFAKTLQTARNDGRAAWAAAQAMLAASFLKHGHYDDGRVAALFSGARLARPPETTALIMAGLIEPQCRRVLRQSRLADWLLLLRSLLRRPRVFWYVMKSRQEHPDWWSLLDQHTAARFGHERGASSLAAEE